MFFDDFKIWYIYAYTNFPANTKNDNIRYKTFFFVLKQMKTIF